MITIQTLVQWATLHAPRRTSDWILKLYFYTLKHQHWQDLNITTLSSLSKHSTQHHIPASCPQTYFSISLSSLLNICLMLEPRAANYRTWTSSLSSYAHKTEEEKEEEEAASTMQYWYQTGQQLHQHSPVTILQEPSASSLPLSGCYRRETSWPESLRVSLSPPLLLPLWCGLW